MKNLIELISVIVLSLFLISGIVIYINNHVENTINQRIPELTQANISTYYKLKLIYQENLNAKYQ
jgi:hypothetical protein